MLNSDKTIAGYDGNPKSITLSIILTTQNHAVPSCLDPGRIQYMIPKEIQCEILVIHYNQADTVRPAIEESTEIGSKDRKNEKTQYQNVANTNDLKHAWIGSKFTCAVMRGVELSNGNYILVADADYPYPEELLSQMINELIQSPDFLIIASRYARGSSVQSLSLGRTVISKGARVLARHGLNVQGIQDPLSGCFAISRPLLKTVKIEGQGDELLLEILVKLNRNKKGDYKIPAKEIPFGQKDKSAAKKINTDRIMSYSKAIWHLYLYGRKSDRLQSDNDRRVLKSHKSVLFLSKAGRFFTVGASGLVVNYLVSLLLSNLIQNIWYIHATSVGIIVSISSNFVLNKVWTFEDWDFSIKHFLRQYGLFLLLCSFGAALQLILVSVFVSYYHIQYPISLITAVSIASIGNFLLNKKITFGEKIWG
jgi:dolichol-phosphate mannosyltransferase